MDSFFIDYIIYIYFSSFRGNFNVSLHLGNMINQSLFMITLIEAILVSFIGLKD